MKAQEIMENLFQFGAQGDYSNTCDTRKAGDPQTEVCKVAVTMTATVSVLRQALDWARS